MSTMNSPTALTATSTNVIRSDYNCFTDSNRYECHFTWVIKNLSFYLNTKDFRKDKILKSEPFSATNNTCKWYLELHPAYEKMVCDDDEDEYYERLLRKPTTLYFKANNSKEIAEFGPIFGELQCSFINSEGEKVDTEKSSFTMDKSCDSFELMSFVENDKMKKLVINDVIKIHCEVSYIQKKDISHTMHLTSIRQSSADPMKDIEKLFNNEDCSDVTIFAKDEKFPAHKIILAARSPVFKAMFTSSMKENRMNRLDIKDITPEGVKEILRYIYTGKVENIETLALELLLAADKYNIEGLKCMTENAVCCAMSTESIFDILSFARLHDLQGLKFEALKYVVSNMNDIIASPQWEKFTSRPDLMKEIIEARWKCQN